VIDVTSVRSDESECDASWIAHKKFGVGRARLIKMGRVCATRRGQESGRVRASLKKFMIGLMECEME